MTSTIQFWMDIMLNNILPKIDDHIHPTLDDYCSFCSLYKKSVSFSSKFGRISHVILKLSKVEENRSIIFFHFWNWTIYDASLVSVSNIRSILSKRTRSIKFFVSNSGFLIWSQLHYQLNQTLRSLIAVLAYTIGFSALVLMNTGAFRLKNILWGPRRLSFDFEQVPFQSLQTRLRYLRDSHTDGQTDGKTVFSFI